MDIHVDLSPDRPSWRHCLESRDHPKISFPVLQLTAPWDEDDQEWRVLEVTYPDDIPFRSEVTKLYFDSRFMLQRLDNIMEVLGPRATATPYCYDHNQLGGI